MHPCTTICDSPLWETWILSWWTYSTIQQILSEHLLCMSYCSRLWEYIKKRYDLHLHGAYTLAEWRRETDNEQKSNKVHTLHMGISARESSNATWRGNGIPAIRELLFETRLAERLHCWHFWSECSYNWHYFRQSKEQAQNILRQKEACLAHSEDSKEVGWLEWTGWGNSGRTEDWGWEADLLGPRRL